MLRREAGELLSRHTSLKIGGPVSCWLEPGNFDEVLEAISIAEASKRPLAVIGKGSNILAQDKGFDGVLMNLGNGFDCIEREDQDPGILKVGPAVSISRLVKQCADWGLGGCEFLSGIPGSFGGAVFMNAGVRDIDDAGKLKEIKDIIVDVDVVDLKDKKRRILDRSNIDFSYRSSGLEGQCILGTRIELKKAKKDAIVNRIDSYSQAREWIQKLGHPSAGSVFKNPDRHNPAGRLIERCGLKGKRIGGAEISMLHANFILNVNRATSKDALDLAELAKDSVNDKFGIELELEWKII